MNAVSPYLQIARFDHWVKNIFMLPGVALAALLTTTLPTQLRWSIPLALLALGLVASANYVINEWLDARFDRHHPHKQQRVLAQQTLPATRIIAWYFLLASVGLGLSWLISRQFMGWNVALLGMGLLYNVPPIRTKDVAYLDVLSESINNPIRFLLGWSLIVPDALPPSSILIAYWMGGAYLMAVKRYAEYRQIGDPVRAELYRRSFKTYNETSLLVSALFHAMMSALMLGVFLIKYRIEFLLSFPLFAILFAWYLAIARKEHSAAQAPEKLHREKSFMAFVAFLCGILWLLSTSEIPTLHILLDPLQYKPGSLAPPQ